MGAFWAVEVYKDPPADHIDGEAVGLVTKGAVGDRGRLIGELDRFGEAALEVPDRGQDPHCDTVSQILPGCFGSRSGDLGGLGSPLQIPKKQPPNSEPSPKAHLFRSRETRRGQCGRSLLDGLRRLLRAE